MMKKSSFVLSTFLGLCLTTAHAGWEYSGQYIGEGWYKDDGSRFVLSVRGGASYGNAKIENDIGELSPGYFANEYGSVISDGYNYLSCGSGGCAGYEFIGYGNIGDLHAKNDYKKFTFAAGASVGWVLPNRSNWRLEIGWDRITQTNYNASPLFDGDIAVSGSDEPGWENGAIINVQSGAVHSTVSTDVISAMAFYDFFDGAYKPMDTIIPYIGFGLGYANSVTELQLTDSYGDLSLITDLQIYGEREDDTPLEFYKSKTTTSNIAGVVAAGISYGLTDSMFLDFGVRFMYVPQIKWALSNEDDTRHRDWFSAKNVLYTNVMLGLRFEF